MGIMMKEIFDSYIETSFDGYAQAEFKFTQFEINYKKYFLENRSIHALDIGIGRGEMLTCMKKWGLNYQGVDISPSTVRFCKSLNLNCELSENTIDWLGCKKNRFDIITCLDVLEHIPRDQTISFTAAIRGALSENGKTIIQVPNLQSPYGYLHHFNDITHINGFVEHSLAQVLLAAGFKNFEFHGFEEIYKPGAKSTVKKFIRWHYRKIVRFMRAVNSNPNPKILDPVLYVVAYK